MWRHPKNKGHQPNDPELSPCVQKGRRLFNFWNSQGSFPVFWSRIKNNKSKLESIFIFFCTMRQLETDTIARKVGDELFERLKSRWDDDCSTDRSALSDKICELKEDIHNLSKKQISAFLTLEKEGLLDEAFELFAAGALTIRREQNMTNRNWKSLTESTDAEDPSEVEPDGPAFFLWAEFAFVACYLGFEVATWKRILPVLLRAEKIFALCYGEPENGKIPPSKKYVDYLNIATGEFAFTTLDLAHSQRIPPLSTNSLESLEKEASNCAIIAFPGEFKVSEAECESQRRAST